MELPIVHENHRTCSPAALLPLIYMAGSNIKHGGLAELCLEYLNLRMLGRELLFVFNQCMTVYDSSHYVLL